MLLRLSPRSITASTKVDMRVSGESRYDSGKILVDNWWINRKHTTLLSADIKSTIVLEDGV
jgi:hypothetical protein